MLGCREFVNADEIAKGLSPFNPESVAIEAGRLMLQRMDDLLFEGEDFAFETTLATRSYVKFVERAQAKGYFVTLLYFWLPTPEQAIERVATRVSEGGHNIPSDVIRRRYANGIKNLTILYTPICNFWTIYDNSSADEEIKIVASMVMKNGWVQACFVGCDRIAANGDFANKIGTSGVAILAKHYGIPFYTLGPTSTIDRNCPDGDHIPIEERDPDEIRTMWYEKPMALPGVKCYNPAFDVTDHSLLTGIVTEKGICYPPFTESIAALFADGKDKN